MNADAGQSSAPGGMPPATHWPAVLLAVGAGFAAAFQLGKLPPAMPLLREEFGLSLVVVGALVSTVSLVAALIGVFAGGIGDRLGALRSAVAGLLITAAASVAGAFTTSPEVLLGTRVVEGIGFILASTALPSLVSAATAPRDRSVALGLWGAFVPGGMGLLMVLSPLILAPFGWRGLWLVVSGVLVAIALLLWIVFRQRHGQSSAIQNRPGFAQALSIVLAAGPILLALCFFSYSVQFQAVTAFMPTLLIEQNSLGLGVATVIAGVGVSVNIVGNVAAGFLLRRGLRRRQLLLAAFAMMALGSAVVYWDGMPVWARLCGHMLFAGFGGLIPGTLFASTPEFARRPEQISALSGFLLQGSAIGQVGGPLLFAAVVQYTGVWHSIPALTIGACLLGAASAVLIGRLASRVALPAQSGT